MRKILFGLLIMGCSQQRVDRTSSQNEEWQPSFQSGPHVMVYKVKTPFHGQVPVVLNDDQTNIITYPGKEDAQQILERGVALPLQEDYWLDKQGIQPHTVFLSTTLEEWKSLPSIPTLQEMTGLIQHREPFSELCDCGNAYTFRNIEQELNQMISEKSLRIKCRVIR